MKLTYTIGTHNEGDVIESLLNILLPSLDINTGDEIVIVDDYSTEPITVGILNEYEKIPSVHVYKHALNKDFATHKNFMTANSTGDYIFNIDADEFPSDYLLFNIKDILKSNSSIDMFILPRVNIVENITDEDIKRYGWNINEKGYINWPDSQGRIYKNLPNILWKNKVHEILTGTKVISAFPNDEVYALYHYKTIQKQRLQNEFYSTIL